MEKRFTYGNDPAASPRDAVRFFAGDTDHNSPRMDDREVDYALTQNSNPRLAAALCLDALAATYSFKASISVGEVSQDLGEIADKLRKRAEELRTEAGRHGVLPFFGGLTLQGKLDLDNRTGDVQPHFRIGQFDSPEVEQFDEGSPNERLTGGG